MVSASVAAAAALDLQPQLRKIGELELQVLGVNATLDPLAPTVPKNVASAVRIVVRAGEQDLSREEAERFLGQGFAVQAELSGPGLGQTLTLPALAPGDPPPNDPLLLPLPALAIAGDYLLSNVRIVAPGGATLLDVSPGSTTVEIIDQILVTSVKTRPLTLDEIKEKGIVVDSDDFLGFEFTLGLKLESDVVDLSFPVVFDREGVVVPQPQLPPPEPRRAGVAASGPRASIVPLLLEPPTAIDEATGERIAITIPGSDEPVRIPSVLVIPGNVGFLKQFFSAQLFVANGAPVGSGLVVSDVTGTVRLPLGDDLQLGTQDDPLALPELLRDGEVIVQPETLPVRGVGLDGTPETADDVVALGPAAQGQAEFLIRGEKEGFHTLDFDIEAVLEGLPVGPVTVTGKATGGVLVRNPFFDMTFTVPAVARQDERFDVFVTVTNIGEGLANDVSVTLDQSRMSGLVLASGDPADATQSIPTLQAGDSQTLAFEFISQRTGQVVASYLNLDTEDGSSGDLQFTLGVGERGVALSPDTLVLPTAVDALPDTVVRAAMRVLGQAWSVAQSPTGALPTGVERVSATVATQKALALAEAGLRVSLGLPLNDAFRDLLADYHGGVPLDAGFDQLLRETGAGSAFAGAVGAALVDPAQGGDAIGNAGGLLAYEREVADLLASGDDFISLVVGSGGAAAPATLMITDAAGRSLSAVSPQIPGGVLVPLGSTSSEPLLGLLADPSASPYTIVLAGTAADNVDLALTYPAGDGSFVRASVAAAPIAVGGALRLVVDLARPDILTLEDDADGDGTFESQTPLALETVTAGGPQLVSASVIGPETLDGATPYGLQTAILFDRVVDEASAANPANYQVPSNAVRAAKRQLSGRLVFASLAQPEGPYVATTLQASGLADSRGIVGPTGSVGLDSRLEDPGAVVTGRVFDAEGNSVMSGLVTYVNNPAIDSCLWPGGGGGLAAAELDANGRFEFRYVRQDQCGYPFSLFTTDPETGARRSATRYVRAAGEQIVLDFALLGRGSVAGTVRDLSGDAVGGARVTVLSDTDTQSGGQAVTDGDGRYEVFGVTVGPVSVRAAAGISAGRAAGRIDRAGTTSTIDVTLDGGAVDVSGTVSKLEGGVLELLPGIGVTFRVNDPATGTDTAVGYVETAPDGSYAFEAMPVGPFRIQAALNTRDRGELSDTGAAGDVLLGRNIVIEIPEPSEFGTVNGVVTFPDGTPAGDVIVSAGVSGVLSGADGSFEIPGIPVRPASTQTVSAVTRDGLRSGRASFLINSGGDVATATIVLSGVGAAELTVLGPDGAPRPGESVRLLSACLDICGCRPTTTDSAGRARFEGLSLGSYNFQVIALSGTTPDVGRTSVTVSGDGETGFGVLRLEGAGSVTVDVTDPSGDPSFGADVELRSKVFINDGFNRCGLFSDVSHRGRTDLAGHVAFEGVHVGSVSVTASQPFLPTQVGATGTLASDGDTLALGVELVDTISGELSGTVYLPDGVTPAGAGIEVTANGKLPDVTVSTDAAGVYRFAKIFPQGHYTVTVRDPVTGGLAQERIYLQAVEDVQHDFRLKGRGTVRVTVVDGAGAPVERASVALQETDFPRRLHEGSVDASNEGAIIFSNVFEGRLSAEASDPFARGGRVSAVLPGPGDTIDVKIPLTTTGTVQGRFLLPDGTTPIPFGSVKLIKGFKTLGQVTTVGTGVDLGTFSFDFVPAGAIRLEAEDPLTGRTGVALGEIANEGQVLELDVLAQGLGTVTGNVTANGVPQPGAHVDLKSGTYSACTIADAAGAYFVDGVPEGRVVATAQLGGGFLAGTASDTLTGEGATVVLDVPLRDSGSVTGHVFAFDGATPAPVSLVSIRTGGVGGATQETTTGSDGAFSFDRVPDGAATLSVDVLGSIDEATGEVVVPSGDNVETSLQLRGVGSIRGVTRDESGNAIGALLKLTGDGYKFTFQTGASGAEQGEYQLPEVLAGPVTASLTADIGGFTLYGSTTGDIVAGQETVLDVLVQPTGTITGVVVRSDGITPAFGTDVEITLPGTGRATVQSQGDGSFELLGIPLGTAELEVFDPVTLGRARVSGLVLDTNGQVLDAGTVVLDATGPTITFVTPAEGDTRQAFGGPVEIDFSDDGSGVDTSTLTITKTTGLNVEPARATANTSVPQLVAGVNEVSATLADLSGNSSTVTVSFTVLGGSVSGIVTAADGTIAAGVPVAAGGEPVLTDAAGAYALTGLKPSNLNVAATDPGTGLATTVSISLADGEQRSLDLQLPAFGSIAGIVREADGAPAEGVDVSTAGRSASSAADGSYLISGLPLASYTLDATNPLNGDRGQASTTIASLGQVASADVDLNGVGDVAVQVNDFGGSPIEAASVSLSSSSPFGDSRQLTTDAAGQALAANVLAGVITANATNPANGLTGETSGGLAAGGSATLTIQLEAAGAIAGTVFEFDGTTQTAAGATVALTGPRNESTTTAADGTYSFQGVPLGAFTIDVSKANDDLGSASGTLTGDGETVQADVTLNGVGIVDVLVSDSAGDPVEGATVRVNPSVGPVRTATSAADGSATLTDVLAGDVTVTATLVSLTGSTTDTLAPATTLAVSVELQPVGTLRGRVLEVDGVTPVAGALVQLATQSTTTLADGVYEFIGLPLQSYGIDARIDGRLRARETATIATNGEVVETDLVLIGVGAVTGTVTGPSAAPASGATVQIVSQAPTFGGVFTTTTAGDGSYSIAGVPIGPFTLSATSGSDRADDSAAIVADGEVVTLDVQLLDSALDLPATLWDANAINWQLQTGAKLQRQGMFPLASGERGPQLRIVSGPDTFTFAPAADPIASEEARREGVYTESLAGLQVTRKIFVPRDGYFVRYLSLIENPGASDATIDVLEELLLTSGYAAITTSSGDAVLDASDTWGVFDDTGTVDIYETGNPIQAKAPIATVVAGPAGLSPTSADATPEGANLRLSHRWDAVTVPAGGRIAFLQTLSVQADRSRAQAAAERLAQLPPELLAGLDLDEAAATLNFDVPVDLVSDLEPIHTDGMVSGNVLAGDGTTPVPASVKLFRSQSPYYGRIVPMAGTQGSFEVRSGFAAPSQPIVVPRAPFDLHFEYSQFSSVLGIRSADVAGDFPASGVIDLTSLVGRVVRASSFLPHFQDLYVPDHAFDGDVSTQWRANTGDTATTQTDSPWVEVAYPVDVTVHEVRLRGIRLSDAHDFRRARIELRAVDGSVLFSAEVDLPAPERDLDVTIPDPTSIVGARAVRVVDLDDVSQTPGLGDIEILGEANGGPSGRVAVDAVFTGTAVVEGTVRRSDGSVVSGNSKKSLILAGAAADSFTADGTFQFLAVPPGTYSLEAAHPAGGTSIRVDDVAVPADQKVVQDLVFPAFGAVSGTLETALSIGQRGTLVLSDGGAFSRTLTSATNGTYSFSDVPPGSYTLEATDLRSGAVVSQAVGVVADQTTTADAQFPPVGTVNVTATVGGVALQSASVSWSSSTRPTPKASGSTNASGLRTVTNVAGPDPTITVTHPQNARSVGTAELSLTSEGQVIDVTVEVAGLGTVQGILRARDGSAIVGRVRLTDPADGTQIADIATQADGTFSFSDVAVEPVSLVGYVNKIEGGAITRSFSAVATGLTSHGETLLVNAPAAAGVLTGVEERWTFDATAGQTIQMFLFGLDTDGTGANVLVDPFLEVFSPDGTLLASNDDRFSSITYSFVSTTAPETGTYGVRVTSADAGAGGYRLATQVGQPDHVFLPAAPTGMGDVTGTVYTADGLTPLPGAVVELVGVDTVVTAADGAFSFADVPGGSYTLQATYVTYSDQAPIDVAGADVVSDFVLGVQVLRGTVTEADASAASATVEACGDDPGGSELCASRTTDAAGGYAIFGLPPWQTGNSISVTAAANDGSSASVGSSFVFDPGASPTTVVDLQFPAAGAVTGVVRDATGALVDGALVNLYTTGGAFLGSQVADGSAAYSFPRVAPGGVDVYAEDADGIPGSATGSVTVDQTTNLDVDLVAAGTLDLGLFDEALRPLAGSVLVRALEAPGPTPSAPTWEALIDLVDAGTSQPLAVSARVPAGLYHVIYDNPGASSAADGDLAPDATDAVALVRASHVELPFEIDGDLGFFSTAAASCADGGCVAVAETVPVAAEPFPTIVEPELADRGVATLRVPRDGLRIDRRVYVPDSGEFARTLVVVQNPGVAPASVILDTVVALPTDEEAADIQTSSDGDTAFELGDTFVYAFTDLAQTGFVLGTAAPTSVQFEAGGGEGAAGALRSSHDVTVPPGEARILLLFTFGSPEDAVATFAQSLVDLTHPFALVGLSAAERAAVFNYAVPVADTGVDGTVEDALGSTVAGAEVVIVDEEGFVVGAGVADDFGAFSIPAPEGDYVLVAVDPATDRPGSLDVSVTAGLFTNLTVALLGDAEVATLDLTGVDETTGSPEPDRRVDIGSLDYAPLYSRTVYLDASGAVSVADVPPGAITLDVPGMPPDIGWEGVSLGPGETRAVELRTGERFRFPIDLTGGDGFPYYAWPEGEVTDADGSCVPFCGTFAFAETEDYFPFRGAGHVLPSGREVSNGPADVAGLEITRRAYVPTAGGFARILDVVTNPTALPVTFAYTLELDQAYETAPFIVSSSSSGDAVFDAADDYVVLMPGDAGVDYAAWVVAGAGAPERHDDIDAFDEGDFQGSLTLWNGITLAPGETKVIMQFVVRAGDAGTAATLASQLTTLTHPDALTGMTATEQSQVINFP